MVGRELASRFFEDRTRPRTTVRPSVRTRLDSVFTNVLRLVVRMRTRDVSDWAFPSLSNFIACHVARAGEGLGRPGNEVTVEYNRSRYVYFQHKV